LISLSTCDKVCFYLKNNLLIISLKALGFSLVCKSELLFSFTNCTRDDPSDLAYINSISPVETMV
jgi:hypothetical protein